MLPLIPTLCWSQRTTFRWLTNNPSPTSSFKMVPLWDSLQRVRWPKYLRRYCFYYYCLDDNGFIYFLILILTDHLYSSSNDSARFSSVVDHGGAWDDHGNYWDWCVCFPLCHQPECSRQCEFNNFTKKKYIERLYKNVYIMHAFNRFVVRPPCMVLFFIGPSP